MIESLLVVAAIMILWFLLRAYRHGRCWFRHTWSAWGEIDATFEIYQARYCKRCGFIHEKTTHL